MFNKIAFSLDLKYCWKLNKVPQDFANKWHKVFYKTLGTSIIYIPISPPNEMSLWLINKRMFICVSVCLCKLKYLSNHWTYMDPLQWNVLWILGKLITLLGEGTSTLLRKKLPLKLPPIYFSLYKRKNNHKKMIDRHLNMYFIYYEFEAT